MRRFELIWIEQSDAARRIMREHDEVSALDYLIGEKLMVFVATAKTGLNSPASCLHSWRPFGKSSARMSSTLI